MDQAKTWPPIIVKRFEAAPYTIPREVAGAIRAPYLRLRDLIVIEHEMSHLIDNVLIDLVGSVIPGDRMLMGGARGSRKDRA